MSWLQVMAMKYPLARDMESNLVRASCLLRPGVGNPVISPVSCSGGIKGIPDLDDAFQTPDFISAKPLWFPVCPLGHCFSLWPPELWTPSSTLALS